MKFKTNEELQRQLELLREWIGKHAAGDVLTYLDAEKDTGVPVQTDAKLRSLLRRALNGRPVETIVGVGYRLSSAESARDIVGKALGEIVGATRRASKKSVSLVALHGGEMSTKDRTQIEAVGSVLSTVQAMTKGERLKIVKRLEK
jgi:hypothetical protein